MMMMTYEAIWDEFLAEHISFPRERCFLKVGEFPNCAGCIDGKHIKMMCLDNCGSMYYKYKQ
jgi:hypothetical protein